MSRHKIDALDARDVHGMRDANRRVIGGTFSGLLITGREVEPGVWLSRNVMLHPTARVTAPVYLGPNTRIGAGAQIGPYAVIGANTILDNRAAVADSLVLPGSYVGEGLDLDGVLVDRSRLVNLEHGVSYTVTDGFILGSTETAGLRGWLRRLLGRVVALGLLALGWPILLLTWLILLISRRGPVWQQLDALAVPTDSDEATWRTTRIRAMAPLTVRDAPPSLHDLLLRVLPLMTSVVTGRLWLVGVPPRSPDEIRALGSDWRALLLGAKAGVIWEAHVARPQGEDALYAAESYYVAQGSLLHDARLVLGYLWRALRPIRRPKPPRHQPIARRS
jgi:lipopolysaccharide/colanic/teichoic acid biosynthesis glycosyltransferase